MAVAAPAVGYRAWWDDAHVGAAVRTALRAHGFEIAYEELERCVEGRRATGQRLRDRALPERLPPFLPAAEYRSLAATDAFLWDRLPEMAGLGHQQAVALGAGADTEEATLCGAFSAGVSLMDYLVDEHDLPVFDVVTPDVVSGMFGSSGAAEAAVGQTADRVTDARLRVLLALVAICAAGFGKLSGARDVAARGRLADAVSALYFAERDVTDGEATPAPEAAVAKAVLPFVVVDRIVTLANGRRQGRDDRASVALGRAVALVDDLVDLAKDRHRGAANSLLLELDRRTSGGSAVAADADVYGLIDERVAELSAVVDPSAAPPGDEPVIALARATVACWAGWDSEPAPRLDAGAGHAPALQAATNMLLGQRRDGYAEATHHMRVPRLTPHGVRIEARAATLFQRAIVLDALLDAHAAGLPVPRAVLDEEAWAILRTKRRDVAGGWSYIADLPELPPDADDLAAVLRVLVRAGGPGLAAACNEPLDLALGATGPDGGFPTWVLERDAELDAAMRAYIELTQSGGVHPDVVANLLSSLVLYGEPRHREAVARAAGYLERVQDARGTWASRWYAGPFYSTARAMVALALAAPSSEALDRAGAFLLASRLAGGGWGERSAEPLATALAVAGLSALTRSRDAPDAEAAVDEGAAWLRRAQAADGGWDSCAFISFARSDGASMHTYGSRTVTTAFCLQALLAASTTGPG